MGIFDLIFDNIYVVVVVLFVIFKLLGSFSNKNKPTSMPTFGGDNPQQGKWRDEQEEADEPYSSPYAPEQQSRPQTTVAQRQPDVAAYEQPRRETVALEQSVQSVPAGPSYEELRREHQRKQALARQKAHKQGSSRSPQAIQLEADDLRKAVVWSEILGQPRAKRPFRRP